MLYTLGLDIGISSIGWAVLANGQGGIPMKIENLSVRIFEKTEHPKDGSSLAAPSPRGPQYAQTYPPPAPPQGANSSLIGIKWSHHNG